MIFFPVFPVPMRLAAVLLVLATCLHAGELPVRIANEARLQLFVPDGGSALPDLRIGPGVLPGARVGTGLADGGWKADMTFPAHWWRWTPVEITFTPGHTGDVRLSLSGPWGQTDDGTEIRREILWDDISAVGTMVRNPGFESRGESAPDAWDSPWRPYPGADAWPLAGAKPAKGKHCAASWHGRPLVQSFRVKKGEEVRLRIFVRAATTPGFQVPHRLGPATPAHLACARLKRGVNLGNCWEFKPGTGTVRFTPADIDRIADEGFDHIRVPVAWQFHLRGDAISPELLAGLDPVLRRACDRRLSVIVDWHNFAGFSDHPDRHRQEFVAGWRVIAEHFAGWPPSLWLELLNEPSNNLSGDLLNGIYAETIAVIRQSNPNRTVVVEPGRWATVPALDFLRLPANDPNLIVSVHNYEPFPVTHQGAEWVGLQDLRGVVFPGPPAEPLAVPPSLRKRDDIVSWIDAYNRMPAGRNPSSALAFASLLADAAEWSAHFGRPVHIGEFGAFQTLEPASRDRYARAFRIAAENRRIPWCWWEWKAGFGYWNPAQNKALLGQALFGKSKNERRIKAPISPGPPKH